MRTSSARWRVYRPADQGSTSVTSTLTTSVNTSCSVVPGRDQDEEQPGGAHGGGQQQRRAATPAERRPSRYASTTWAIREVGGEQLGRRGQTPAPPAPRPPPPASAGRRAPRAPAAARRRSAAHVSGSPARSGRSTGMSTGAVITAHSSRSAARSAAQKPSHPSHGTCAPPARTPDESQYRPLTIVRGRTPARIPTFDPMDDVIAARATDLTKVYGQGETQVVALDAVSVDFGRASSPRSWAPPAPASRR